MHRKRSSIEVLGGLYLSGLFALLGAAFAAGDAGARDFIRAEPKPVVDDANAVAECGGRFIATTKASSARWLSHKDSLVVTLKIEKKKGRISIWKVFPNPVTLRPGHKTVVSVQGHLAQCSDGSFFVAPFWTPKGGGAPKRGLAGAITVPAPPMALLIVSSAHRASPAIGTFSVPWIAECCKSSYRRSYELSITDLRNIEDAGYARTANALRTLVCPRRRPKQYGGWIRGRLADPEKPGSFRVEIWSRSSTTPCRLSHRIVPAKKTKVSLRGIRGKWLVNANNYTFVMDLSGASEPSAFEGSLTGLNNDNPVTYVRGSFSGETVAFARWNTENERVQEYIGKLITSDRGRWMVGSFRWNNRTYDWCAADAELVPSAQWQSWSDCRIGGRPLR